MTEIILRREGREDVVREIDEVNPAISQYIDLPGAKREVYNFLGAVDDDAGAAIYEYQGTNERDAPTVKGTR